MRNTNSNLNNVHIPELVAWEISKKARFVSMPLGKGEEVKDTD